jgi:hypothetical protein
LVASKTHKGESDCAQPSSSHLSQELPAPRPHRIRGPFLSVVVNGTMVYLPGEGPTATRSLGSVGRRGGEQALRAPRWRYHMRQVSPDGRRSPSASSTVPIAISESTTPGRESLMPLRRSHDGTVAWSPDGASVLAPPALPVAGTDLLLLASRPVLDESPCWHLSRRGTLHS